MTPTRPHREMSQFKWRSCYHVLHIAVSTIISPSFPLLAGIVSVFVPLYMFLCLLQPWRVGGSLNAVLLLWNVNNESRQGG